MGFCELILVSDTFLCYKQSKNIDGSQKKWANPPQSVKKHL